MKSGLAKFNFPIRRLALLAAAFFVVCACVASSSTQVSPTSAPGEVSTNQFTHHITQFLGQQIDAHVADLKSLNPPQERVVGALTTGEFSWGSFMRALASYSALSGQQTIEGKNLPHLIGQIGLIEAKNGGKTFAQLYGALALREFGTDLNKNAVWQSLTPEEQAEWRSLLDPSRFYDRKTRHVINLPENYFGVAALIVTIDYQLGIIRDRTFVDDVLDRAAEQFTEGNLFSDDGLPAGRYDRYSNEYARNVYTAAANVGRTDIMKKLEPSLKTQMQLWWNLMSPDGYGYPWGRSLGVISYEDTLEIVAFLAEHPEFRPAPMPELAAAYYQAWNWIENDFKAKPHLLNVFGFGRGNYSYINPTREWQQTATFFGKASNANRLFEEFMKKDGVAEFPSKMQLPDVTRFQFFRKGPRPAGVWLVRHGGFRFALPIVAGTRPGMSDYLPAPYDLPGFAPPVEQLAPTVTPFLQLEDGRVVFAGDAADEIDPAPDAMSLRAVWKRWAVLGTKAGALQDVGLTSVVDWKIEGDSLIRTETVTSSKPVQVKRFWVIVPSTANRVSTLTENGQHVDRFVATGGTLDVSIQDTNWPLQTQFVATGNSNLGKGSRGPIPLYLDVTAQNVTIEPGHPMKWTLVMTSKPAH